MTLAHVIPLFFTRVESSTATGSMRAAAVQWDLSAMEIDELLTEKTILFIAKVCRCYGGACDLDRVRRGAEKRYSSSTMRLSVQSVACGEHRR